SDIVRTQGQIAGEKAKLDPKLLAAAKTQLEEKARQNGVKTAPGYDDIAKQAYTNAMAPWGTGSALQQGISAATAAASALAGGNVAGAVAGGAAPYLAGASGGAAGEYIAQQLYPGVDRADLSEEQRQTTSALGKLAAGLAGGLAGDSAGAAVTGAQAGKNALENNNLLQPPRATPVPVPGLPLSPGDKVVQNANNIIASELDKTLKRSGTEADTPPITDGRAIVEARDDTAKSRNPKVAHNQQHQDGSSNKTETAPVNDDLTGGKLVNPFHDENKRTSLVTPDRSGEQGPGNTGNSDGLPDTGGNTTVTPIPEYNKDDLAYLALRGKEAQETASNLGFERKIIAPKAPFNSLGQPVFFDGKTYITPDVDSHNVTNGWKMFDRKGKRMGTYDSDLKRVKD
ncbi:VENN motif pre-toxin domain-containing protein, partial [Erwinia sp. ACCC 02193]